MRQVGAMLLNDEALESATTTSVGRGLYLLRYVSGAVSGRSPVAIVRPAPGSEPFIEVISAPGVVSGFLARPGDCLVVRAEQPGSLSVKLIRQSSGKSIDASLRLEPIAAVEASFAPAPARAAEPAPSRREAEGGIQLRLCGHVARRGDVEVSAAQWVAGPGAPAAIEGIEIRGAFPAGVESELRRLSRPILRAGSTGLRLAHSPARADAQCRSPDFASGWEGRPRRDMSFARMRSSWDLRSSPSGGGKSNSSAPAWRIRSSASVWISNQRRLSSPTALRRCRQARRIALSRNNKRRPGSEFSGRRHTLSGFGFSLNPVLYSELWGF